MGLLLAMPLGSAWAADFTLEVDNDNLTYNITESISSIGHLNLSVNDGGKYVYNKKEVNDLTLNKVNHGTLISVGGTEFNLAINGAFTANLTGAANWAPVVHLDAGDSGDGRKASITAENITLANNYSHAINIVTRAENQDNDLTLTADDSIKISTSGNSAAVNLTSIDYSPTNLASNNTLNINAGGNIEITSAEGIAINVAVGTVNMNADGDIEIKAGTKRDAINNSGMLKINQKDGQNSFGTVAIESTVNNTGRLAVKGKEIEINYKQYEQNDWKKALQNSGNGTVDLDAIDSLKIISDTYAIDNETGNINLSSKSIVVQSNDTSDKYNKHAVLNKGTLNFNENIDNMSGTSIRITNGINNSGELTAKAADIVVENSSKVYAIRNYTDSNTNQQGKISLLADNSLNITSSTDTAINNGQNNEISLAGKNTAISGNKNSIDNSGTFNINKNECVGDSSLTITNRIVNRGTLNASAGSINILTDDRMGTTTNVIYSVKDSTTNFKATSGDLIINNTNGKGVRIAGTANFEADDTMKINVYERALEAASGSVVDIKASNVDIFGGTHAINAYGESTVTVDSSQISLEAVNGVDPTYGKYELGVNISSGSKVILTNAKNISIEGGISVKGNGTNNTDRISTLDVAADETINIKGTIKNVGESTQGSVGGIININKEKNEDTAVNIEGDIYSGRYAISDADFATASGGSINIYLGNAQSSLVGNIHDNDADGVVDLTINNGATWNSDGDSLVKAVNSSGGIIKLANEEQNIEIKTLGGESVLVETNSLKNKVHIGQNNNADINLHATESVTNTFGNNIAGGMQKLHDVIDIENGSKAMTANADAGAIIGDVTAKFDTNGNLISFSEGPNQYNQGISEMASIALMTWRQENNDMNKRLGELRDSKGEHGVWARMTRGEAKYGNQNIKNQYNSYQLGYDEKLSVDKKWTVGAAFTYTDANSSFTNGHGENKHKGFAVYGSRLNNDGSFIDLIAKYARLEHEFDVNGGAGKGDCNTNGYSVSAEYGKRFTNDKGLWIEPQVELTYGKIGSVNYVTNQDVSVRQDGMESVVGRVGFALGKNFKQGNAYLRASYLYDFDGETGVRFAKGGSARSFEQDLGGGWWEVGVGANVNISEATHLYFDVEKTYGGNVATPWQWNAGVRWSF